MADSSPFESSGLWLDRLDRLLTLRRARLYAGAIGFGLLAGNIETIVVGHWPFDSARYPVAVDFLAQLGAARLIRAGVTQRIYDLSAQVDAQTAILGRSAGGFAPSRLPPVALYLYAPLATLPYALALAIWTALGLILLLAGLFLVYRGTPRLRGSGFATVVLFTFVSEPFLFNLFSGEDAAILVIIYAAGLALLLARRDAVAGLVLGLGIIKPQLFLFVPIFLFGQRRWLALAGWVVASGALGLLSVGIVGIAGARSYLALLGGTPFGGASLDSIFWWRLASVPAMIRAFLPPEFNVPYSLVVVVVGSAVLLRWWPGRPLLRQSNLQTLPLEYSYLILISVLFAPHLVVYDLLVLAIPVLILLDRASTTELRLAIAVGYVLLWTGETRFSLFGGLPFPLSVVGWPLLPLVLVLVARAAARAIGPNVTVLPPPEARLPPPI